jgi:hypothetical protein
VKLIIIDRLFAHVYIIVIIGVRDGGAGGAGGQGGQGGSCPPRKIRKSKSRANVQHKSGEKWEIKKRKREKVPGSLGKQRHSDNIGFTVGHFWLILMFRKNFYVRKIFLDP